MRKVLLCFVIILLIGCSTIKITPIDMPLPEPYMKAYRLHGADLYTEEIVQEFLEEFTVETDFVICVAPDEYLILRK